MLVFNLQEPTTVVKDGKPLQLRRGMIKDSTDKMPIIIFEPLIEQISEGSCYDMYYMTNMLVTNISWWTNTENDWNFRNIF